MGDYLRRLGRTAAAYQAGETVAKIVAVFLLPVYTRRVDAAGYGTVDLLTTLVILIAIVARFGFMEALVRFHFDERDESGRKALARAATGLVLLVTTALAVPAALAAGPLSCLVLGHEDAATMRIAALGLWAFANLEMAMTLLRIEERAGAFLRASLTNVGLTIAFTLYLVVVRDEGARGLLAGNFAASTIVLLGVWAVEREKLGIGLDRARLGPLLRFGLPLVPAEVSIFALNLVDRTYLYRVESPREAGLYSLAVKLTAVVIFVTRAFQYAWPPLAYSIEDDAEAERVYARVTTYFVALTGIVVAALALLGRWAVRLLAAPSFFGAHEALPWVGLGWALSGLFFVFAVMAGRAKVTTRNFPAALVGLAVNVVLLLLLVPPLGIAGAGIALCGAQLSMLAVMYAFTRSLFAVGFEWGRLARVVVIAGGLAVAGEVLLPTSGAAGLLSRIAVAVAIPPALLATGFLSPDERAGLRSLATRLRARG
jgi:O-antigen/teichoic acid export membrane protein